MSLPELFPFELSIARLSESHILNPNLVDHLDGHIPRVAVYAKNIAEAEEFDDKIYEILITCYYHDRPRIHDGDDQEHGKQAALLISREPIFRCFDVPSMTFAVEHHADRVAPNGKYPIVQNYIGQKGIDLHVAAALWDADRLDLIRIPFFKGRVDPNYLSTEYAKSFANTKKHLSNYKCLNL